MVSRQETAGALLTPGEVMQLPPAEELVLAAMRRAAVQLLGQPATDLVEHEANERLGPGDVGWRDDQIERNRRRALDQIGNAPVAA